MGVRFRQIDTLEWDINSSYEVGTEVVYSNKRYISKKNVPVGVNIGSSLYWKKLELADDVEELAEAVEDNADAIGTLANLTTTAKSNLVNAINEIDGNVGTVSGKVTVLENNSKVTVGEDTVTFKFAYSDGVYGFMVGEVFHPFGAEVVPETPSND